MLYILTGKGTMPPKEAVTVLSQLLDNAEREARESGLETVDFWMAVETGSISADEPFWRAIDRWSRDEDVFVAEVSGIADLVEGTLNNGEEISWLLVSKDPAFKADEDDYILDYVDAWKDRTNFYAFNGQMYEVEGAPKTSDEDLESLSRDELKKRVRELGVTPKDWRSKDALIEAIREQVSLPKPSDRDINSHIDPENLPEVNEVLEGATDLNATEQPESEVVENRHFSELPGTEEFRSLVEPIIKDVLREVLLEALNRTI